MAYGARALVKGGLQALPELTVPGAVLAGDDAGFLNYLKIKGSHTAMKSGMLAAEAIGEKLAAGSEGGETVPAFAEKFRDSWLLRNSLKRETPVRLLINSACSRAQPLPW